jgi:hypothetical protein
LEEKVMASVEAAQEPEQLQEQLQVQVLALGSPASRVASALLSQHGLRAKPTPGSFLPAKKTWC